jgi:hypothetical protein
MRYPTRWKPSAKRQAPTEAAPMIDMEKRRASWRRYNTSPRGHDRAWRHRQGPLYQEAKRRYVESPKGRETTWRYEHESLDRKARRHTPAAREREASARSFSQLFEGAARRPVVAGLYERFKFIVPKLHVAY